MRSNQLNQAKYQTSACPYFFEFQDLWLSSVLCYCKFNIFGFCTDGWTKPSNVKINVWVNQTLKYDCFMYIVGRLYVCEEKRLQLLSCRVYLNLYMLRINLKIQMISGDQTRGLILKFTLRNFLRCSRQTLLACWFLSR